MMFGRSLVYMRCLKFDNRDMIASVPVKLRGFALRFCPNISICCCCIERDTYCYLNEHIQLL